MLNGDITNMDVTAVESRRKIAAVRAICFRGLPHLRPGGERWALFSHPLLLGQRLIYPSAEVGKPT